jgi:hypothetical protein
MDIRAAQPKLRPIIVAAARSWASRSRSRFGPPRRSNGRHSIAQPANRTRCGSASSTSRTLAKVDAHQRDAQGCLEAASAVLGKTAGVPLVKQSANRCTSIAGIEPDLARDPGKDVGIHVRRLANGFPIAGKQQPVFRIRAQQGCSDNRRFCLHDGRPSGSTNLRQPQPAFVETLPLSITARFAFFGQRK